MKSRRLLWLLVCFAACATPGSTTTTRTVAPLRQAEAQETTETGCPVAGPGRLLARPDSDALREASGLIASRRNRDVFWTHNDSGDRPRAFAIDAQGAMRAELNIGGAHAEDWEDIALLPGATADQLLLADIGDNLSSRESVQIYIVSEPRLPEAREPLRLQARARRLDVRYEDGPRDAETLLADPLTGDLYLVEKAFLLWRNARVGVYRIPGAETSRSEVSARRVAELQLGPVTSGDVRPDGLGVALRNYRTARYFPRALGQPLFEALHGDGCALELADTGKQGEALCFAGDGQSYFTITEGQRPHLYRYDLGAR